MLDAPAIVPPSPSLEIGEIFRAHAESVHRWAVRLGGPGVDADDVVQEVFLVAQRRLSEFRGEAKIETWLYRITEIMVRKQLGGVWRRRIRGLFEASEAQSARSAQPRPLTPLDALEKQEASQLVYRALAGLPDRQRQAVILYELEGLSGEEIAELTGTKLATVWVLLHRGRQRFVAKLRELEARGDLP